MGIRRHIVSAVAALAMTAGLMAAAHAEPLRISLFHLGRQRAVLRRPGEGLVRPGRRRGRADQHRRSRRRLRQPFRRPGRCCPRRHAGCPDVRSAGEEPLVCVLALDDSPRRRWRPRRPRTSSPIADLKGKLVAVVAGQHGVQFYLNVLLKEAGLSEADIEVVELSAEDAGEAFALQEVDAAVTIGALLSQARNAEHGHRPDRHPEQPGLIVDCLMTKADVSMSARRTSGRSPAPGMRRCAMSRRIPMRPTRSWPAIWAAGSKIRPSSRRPCEGVGFYDAAAEPGIFRHARSTPARSTRPCNTAIDVWTSLGVLKMQTLRPPT